jgi:hypothetical protein
MQDDFQQIQSSIALVNQAVLMCAKAVDTNPGLADLQAAEVAVEIARRQRGR